MDSCHQGNKVVGAPKEGFIKKHENEHICNKAFVRKLNKEYITRPRDGYRPGCTMQNSVAQ